MRQNAICGLDIGVSSIRALIAQPLELQIKEGQEKEEAAFSAREKILGFSESPTKGFSKGVVSNLNLLSDAIEDAVAKAEAKAHCKIRKLITNISGVHIRTFKSRGSVHISDRPSEIREADLKRCIESARLIAMSLDREVIHLIPERFYIDDKIEITEPVGLFGSKLDVDLNIVTSLVSILQNLAKAINMAGYEVEDVITSGAGTALAVLGRKELADGAIVIDVGKDLTEATLFMDGKMVDCFYFPFGSDDLTQVLQDKLKIMFEEAEGLRVKYGIVTKDNQELYDDVRIPIKNMPGPDHGDTQSGQKRSGGNWVDSELIGAGLRLFKEDSSANIISRRELSNILFPKVEEIMQDVYKKIGPFLRQRKKLPYICVVGGVSKMDGFIEVVEEIFNVPVGIGRIRDAKDLHDTTFACALGLARYGASRRIEKEPGYISDQNNFAGRLISKVRSLLSEYF